MAWSSEIIPDNSRSVTADENGACVLNLVGYVVRLCHQHFHVFGSDMVDQIDRIVLAVDNESNSVIHNRRASDRTTVQHFKLSLKLVENGGGESSRPADEPDSRHLVVFSLCQQVRCNPGWIARFIRYDRDFTRSGHHIDIDNAVNLAFCRLNILVAGTNDLLNSWNSRCSIRQRANRLRTSDSIHFIQFQELQSGGYKRVLFERTWRRHD